MTSRTASTPRTRRRSPRGSGEQLRAEIVTAAKELLANAGDVDSVSIRAVADAVGVTPPSIYLHFADKQELIDAVCSDVFVELDAAMLAAAEGIEGSMLRLCEFGMAYIRFAVAHPEHYRLATMGRTSDDPGKTDLVLAESAFTHMMDTVQGCMDEGVFEAGDPLPIALEMWAAAHGVASLLIVKPFLPWGDPEAFAFRALRSVALGHALNDLLGGDLDPQTSSAWFAAQRATRDADRSPDA